MCEPVAYHEVLEPERGAGAAPFSVERLGRKVEGVDFEPVSLTLKNDNRVVVDWMLSDWGFDSHLIYSPAEGLARDVENSKLVYPMKRLKDGWSEHVRFGFRSTICLGRDPFGAFVFCQHSKEALFLVADMTCHSVIAEEVVEEQLFNARE
jgi:hypothetical protein